MTSGIKLTVGMLVVSAAIGYLAYVGAANSWQYYLSVDETVTDSADLVGRRIRVSGRVEPGSLRIGVGRRDAEFDLVGELHKLHVSSHCALPDNFAEGIEVVVEGKWQGDHMHGHKVITRCASKYQRAETSMAQHESADPLILR
jgi:cytochrome c-type biogenesis protein CcmE